MEENMNCQNGRNPSGGQTIIVNNVPAANKNNGFGIAGFVLALVGVVFCWVPAFDWVVWILGLVFSVIGVCRKPRGLAIAGLALSLLGVILIVLVMGVFAAALATM